MAYTDDIAALTRNLRNLTGSDADFARSLIRSVESHGFATEKQTYWLQRMARKAAGLPEVETKTAAVGDLAAVYAMFETAKKHLKKPAVVLGYSRAGRTSELTIYVAGPQSRTPGALQVKDDDGTWWGRVHQDGNFEQSRRDPPPMGVVDILRRFAADPMTVAAEHGHLSGKCCFCNRKLTDPKSTAVGYGPICAEHFGLAWGSRAAQAAREPQSLQLAATGASDDERPSAAAPVAANDEGPDPEDMAERNAVAGAWSFDLYATGGR